jgi:hypothetical protein
MNHELYVKRIIALDNARARARNPEWKKLWLDIQKRLIRENQGTFKELH